MELEPITRQEKIISGQDLTPITRREMFLKQYGGGGGGGGSTDAVLYTAQTLTDAQKKQARDNVDAASEFVVNATINSDIYGNYTATSDKTFGQIKEAVNGGKRAIAHLIFEEANIEAFAPLMEVDTESITFGYMSSDGNSDITMIVSNTLVITSDRVEFYNDYALSLDSDTWEMPQIFMASGPNGDMQIATKKYVDDKGYILHSTTPGSTKKFKITVDDSGAISATEVT